MSFCNDDFSSADSDDDDTFEQGMEALRRACILTGANPKDIQPSTTAINSDSCDSEDDDLELAGRIKRIYSVSAHYDEPEPLDVVNPGGSDGEFEDDIETLRKVERMFALYNDSLKNSTEEHSHPPKQVGPTNKISHKETCSTLCVDDTNISEEFLDTTDSSVNPETNPFASIHSENVARRQIKGTVFTECVHSFFVAIQKNRTCQKFLRSKLMQIEGKIEENKKLMKHIRILKDFQITCRKRIGRALSQKRDDRVQLISTAKASSSSKVNGKKVPAMFLGPLENPNVGSYRMVLKKYPLTLNLRKWSNAEDKNLARGIEEQFQQRLYNMSLSRLSHNDAEDSDDIDNYVGSIRDLDITPEKLRLFLPQVDWDQLAFMHVSSRSGPECRARWLNCIDPLINKDDWKNPEDKKLLHVVQQNGVGNWIDIAVSLGTNRPPFECLKRYQRSLNGSILKKVWTKNDDDKLRDAVAELGGGNWQLVATKLDGWTGSQCSNRWVNTLSPSRDIVGTWNVHEDKRLKVAVLLFQEKNWRKIASYVPGRTHTQCRERWTNCINPGLKMGPWTKDEDSKLKDAIARHRMRSKIAWSKVAACVAPRTDNQCRRRWLRLNSAEVVVFQEARKVEMAALPTNFVNRQSEKSDLGHEDFLREPLLGSVPEFDKQRKRKRRRVQDVLTFSAGADLPMKKRVKRKRLKRTIPFTLSKDNVEDADDSKKKDGPIRGKRKPVKPKKKKARKIKSSYTSEDSDESAFDDDIIGICSDNITENKIASDSRPCKSTDVKFTYKRRIKGQLKKSTLTDEEIKPFQPVILACNDNEGAGDLDVDDNVEEIPLEQNCKKKQRKKKVKQVEEDDLPLAFYLKLNRRRQSAALCPKPLDEENGDDMTLASFCKALKINNRK